MSKKKNDPNDLIGFKDFIEQDKNNTPAKKNKDSIKNYEVMTFLGQEVARLKNSMNLLEEKTFMLKNFPQDTKLTVQQEAENLENKLNLITDLSENGDILKKNLNELLSSHFNF